MIKLSYKKLNLDKDKQLMNFVTYTNIIKNFLIIGVKDRKELIRKVFDKNKEMGRKQKLSNLEIQVYKIIKDISMQKKGWYSDYDIIENDKIIQIKHKPYVKKFPSYREMILRYGSKDHIKTYDLAKIIYLEYEIMRRPNINVMMIHNRIINFIKLIKSKTDIKYKDWKVFENKDDKDILFVKKGSNLYNSI